LSPQQLPNLRGFIGRRIENAQEDVTEVVLSAE
jgi:hypothetical protein